jgi:hypothetical protein
MPIDTSSSDYPPSNEWTEWEKIAFGTQYAYVLEQEKIQSEQRERNREDRKKRMNKARLKLNQKAQSAPGARSPGTLSTADMGNPGGVGGGLGGGLSGTSVGGGLSADSVPQRGGGAAPLSAPGETKGRRPNPADSSSGALATTSGLTDTHMYMLLGGAAIVAYLLLRRS